MLKSQAPSRGTGGGAAGKNAAAVVNDEMSSGPFSSLPESIAAATAGCPASRFTMIDSTMTIALSTNRPRAMINAVREIWLIVISNNCIENSDATTVAGISEPTTRPVRKPRNTIMTRITMMMAWPRPALEVRYRRFNRFKRCVPNNLTSDALHVWSNSPELDQSSSSSLGRPN